MAAAAMMFAACSDDLKTEMSSPEIAKNNTELSTAQLPVSFGAYVNRATTRAGSAGVLTTDGLNAGEIALKNVGFGVFGYYTNGELYNSTTVPDFFYNQQVSHNGTEWSYEPVKYWPNEYGKDAISDETDRLSFFAYAPWVDVKPSTGVVTGSKTSGIVGMSRNTTKGDPFVKYITSFNPASQVDFVWGVAGAVPEAVADNQAEIDINNAGVTGTFKDLVKIKTDQKVQFDFKHALAQLNVQIDALVDSDVANDVETNHSRIFVRSITFEGFATQGSFNLNQDYVVDTNPEWSDMTGDNTVESDPVTIYDGRTDGKEGVSNASNEKPTGLNTNIIQPVGEYQFDANNYITVPAATVGVTKTAQNLFNSTTVDAPILVIPTGSNVNVTIVYDVETVDPKLATYLSDGVTHGSSIQNAITKTIKLGASAMKLMAGKKHTVKLHLGMETVKFDASVSDWAATDPAETNVYLPGNAYVALTSTGPAPASIDASNIVLAKAEGADDVYTFDLAMSDTDASVTSYAATSSDDTKVTVSVAGTVLTLTAKDGQTGDATITLTPSSASGTLPPTTIKVKLRDGAVALASGTATIASGTGTNVDPFLVTMSLSDVNKYLLASFTDGSDISEVTLTIDDNDNTSAVTPSFDQATGKLMLTPAGTAGIANIQITTNNNGIGTDIKYIQVTVMGDINLSDGTATLVGNNAVNLALSGSGTVNAAVSDGATGVIYSITAGSTVATIDGATGVITLSALATIGATTVTVHAVNAASQAVYNDVSLTLYSGVYTLAELKANAASVGDLFQPTGAYASYVKSNGYLVGVNNYTSLANAIADGAIGVVAFVQTDNTTDVDDGVVGSRILVLSLGSAGSGMWKTSNTLADGSNNDGGTFTPAADLLFTARKGLAATNRLGVNAEYPAFKLAYDFNDNASYANTGITGASRWFLPSRQQMTDMKLKGTTTQPGTITFGDSAYNLVLGITSGNYWSSSEGSETVAHDYRFNNSRWLGGSKASSRYVRPVFAY